MDGQRETLSPIEEKLLEEIGTYVVNTHIETSITVASITLRYHKARHIIKEHLKASYDDVLITVGTEMSVAISKFHRILGLKVLENLKDYPQVRYAIRPIVFL